MSTRLCVVGGGWAGLAAAVEGVRLGAQVTLLEMAPNLGGRARSLGQGDDALDSGHHILIGAYTATLDLMRRVGAEPEELLWRSPLALVDGKGEGLRWPVGRAPLPSLLQAVVQHPHWQWREKLALAAWGAALSMRGLRCPKDWTVERLCTGLPQAIRAQLFEPLCIAALNTPIQSASAAVFLRVLRDALLGGRGAADLLLPRRPLSQLLPGPAHQWLLAQGVEIQLGRRVQCLRQTEGDWMVDGLPAHAVILACSSAEAARLAQAHNSAWSYVAQSLQQEAIATAYFDAPGVRLAAPMVALSGGPAQFVFDLAAIGGPSGRFAAVGSAVVQSLALGREAITAAMQEQLVQQLPALKQATLLRSHADRRATFACTAGLPRPATQIADGLFAAGDFVEGPYPATLEGAVRSGLLAAREALTQRAPH